MIFGVCLKWPRGPAVGLHNPVQKGDGVTAMECGPKHT